MMKGILAGSESKKNSSISPLRQFSNSNLTARSNKCIVSLNPTSFLLSQSKVHEVSTSHHGPSVNANGGSSMQVQAHPYYMRSDRKDNSCGTSRLCLPPEGDRKDTHAVTQMSPNRPHPGHGTSPHRQTTNGNVSQDRTPHKPHHRTTSITTTPSSSSLCVQHSEEKSRDYVNALIAELESTRQRESRMQEKYSQMERENRQLSDALAQLRKEYKDNMIALLNENKSLNEKIQHLNVQMTVQMQAKVKTATSTMSVQTDPVGNLDGHGPLLSALSKALSEIELNAGAKKTSVNDEVMKEELAKTQTKVKLLYNEVVDHRSSNEILHRLHEREYQKHPTPHAPSILKTLARGKNIGPLR